MLMDIQFASTINKKYIQGAKVFLKSLLQQNPNFNYTYNFLIIDNSLTSEDKIFLKQIYPNIKFLDILNNDYTYDSLSCKWRNWGYNCFNRFDIFLIECDKLIFFDLDLICLKPIDELLSFDCDFGAVKAPEDHVLDHPNKQYFDGGVMVISKKYLNNNTKQELIKISKSRNWTSDEPVLNTFFNNIFWLPKKYNVLTSEYNGVKEVVLLQYVGAKKPWFSKQLTENFDDFIFKTQGGLTVVKLQSLFNSI